MAIVFNGTSNLLSWAGNIRSALPITLFGWVKRVNTSSLQTPFSTANTANMGFVRAATLAYNVRAYGDYSHATGYGDSVQNGVDTSEFAWNPLMVTVSSSVLSVWFGAAQTTGATQSISSADTLSAHNIFTIGGLGSSPSFIGEISDVAVWNTALGDTEWATLKAGTAPEGVSAGSLVEAWALRELGEYTGVNGRTLVATGTLARSSTDPFVRSSPAATATTLSGPSSGTSGVASTNFTVGANGTITGTVTVTPDDAANGGTFTPTTVAISSGTPTATFTYTPASAGTKTISISDNGGLTDAASLTYTSNAASVTATGSLASMSLVAPTSSATGSAAATGSLGGITIIAPTASASGANVATGALASIQLGPPTATATGAASATGSLRVITLTAPTATAVGSVAGSGTLTFPLTNNTGTLLAGETGATVHIFTATWTHVVTKTGQTSNGAGVMTVTDAALTAATEYRVVPVLASGDEGMDRVTAA